MEESNTTSSTTSKKTPLPLRERIVRKAKEKAAITLHELTTNPRQSGVSTNNETTISEANSTIKSPAMKRNNRSYKPFPELNNQQQSDEEQSETEYETPKKQSRTRRKTPATASTTVTKPKGSRLQKQLQAAAANGGGETDITDSTSLLFTQIYEGQTALQALVDDWIESYKREPNGAMLELMRLIVRSSGCKAVRPLASLPRELLKSKEFTECINELVEAFSNDEEQTEQYPLVLGSVAARRFRANLAEFIQLLVNQCQYSIVYDQFMLDVFITFLIALADSQVRAFRHTATLVVLKIMTALVDVLLSLSISKDANQRQYENERSKAASKRANDRIEMLTSKRKELEENEYEIQNFINFIFKAVFIHRYRDVCADIRCICINEIGEWMRKCAEKFLDDTFLKYIGWTLYDRVAECRLKCLQALHPLYEQDDLQARLELFTSRFKNRMVEMTLDRDVDVSVSAIRLLTKIVSRNDAALEDKDCENVYELVYHSNRQIAQAAGGFLNQKLFVKVENPTIEFRRVGGRKQSENGAFIQLLVQFLIESELHDHPTYLVDAMWETHDMLKDWQSMTDLLLEDPVNPEDGLDDLHERYLVEIMCCCVKQAATGEYPVSRRTQLNRKLTAKEAKQVESDRIELTQHFITTLPSLLTKYIADAEKLVYLLQIATHFDLNQYTLNRQEKSLDKLLKLIVEILSKHNDAALLDECSKLLCYVCDEETPIYSKANVTRSSVLDDLVDKFTSAMRAFDQLTEVDENEMYPLQVALKRLAAFADNHDITNYDLVQNTFTILKWAVYNEGFGHELVERALTLARSIITWNMQKLEAECAASAAGEDADSTVTPLTQSARDLIEYISKLSKKFYKLCNKLFVNDNPQIEEEAYFELCDLLILFNINLISVNREYKPLVLECSTNDINMLSVYVMNNVFSPEAATERAETAESIEKLHKRRCILASFCKLISYNSVPIKYAAEIFRGYVKYSASYGDIIKSLLSNCREISKVNTAKTIALALQREYNEAVLNTTTRGGGGGNRLDRNSVEFTSLKELAHKFCLSFGPEASMKSREAIVAIHHEAINYASESASAGVNQAPVNLPFLEIVTEFSSRLTAQDKKSILNELDKKFAKRANKIDDNNWHAYYVYRLTLMEDYQHQQHQQQQQQNHQTLASTTTVATTNGTSHPTESTTTKTIETADETTAPTTTTTSSTKTVFAAPSVPSSILRRPQPLANSTAVGMSVGRRKETSFDMTGIARIKETRPRATDAAATAAVANDENSYDEEDDENLIDEQNLHADSTMNELAGLKLNAANSGGNHAETNGRRSNRLKGQQTSSNSNTTNSTNSANSANNHKRPRSPLVSTNNSINDSSSIVERDINRFESTRNDGPSKRDTIGGNGAGTSTRGKMSIPITPLHSAVGHVEESSVLGDDVDTTVSGGGAGGPVTKRKRKSTLQNEENNTDTFKPLSVN